MQCVSQHVQIKRLPQTSILNGWEWLILDLLFCWKGKASCHKLMSESRRNNLIALEQLTVLLGISMLIPTCVLVTHLIK